MKRLSRFVLFAFVFATPGSSPVAAGSLPAHDVLCATAARVAVRTVPGRPSCTVAAAECRGPVDRAARPVVTSIKLPANPVAFGESARISAGFTTDDTHDVHSATIDWGDGSTTELQLPAGTLSVSHRYAPGVYTVGVGVRSGQTSDFRCSSAEPTSFVVVYDPAAAHVTGSGWLQSAAGWCTIDDACKVANGLARFGFVFHYQKRASVLVHHAQLEFVDGAFRFQSMTHDGLAISSGTAQLRGGGRVNGRPGFEFLLTIHDGDLDQKIRTDRMRIRIWEKASGRVVYDNRRATVIGGNLTIR